MSTSNTPARALRNGAALERVVHAATCDRDHEAVDLLAALVRDLVAGTSLARAIDTAVSTYRDET